MNLRNLVDAIRRKPATEPGPPKEASDPILPPVEVSDIVAGADGLPPWNQTTGALMQSLLGGLPAPGNSHQKFSEQPGKPTNGSHAYATTPPSLQSLGFAAELDIPIPSPPPTSSEANSPANGLTSSVTFPPLDDSWFEASIPTAPLSAGVSPHPSNEFFPSFSPPNGDTPSLLGAASSTTPLISPKQITELLQCLNQAESVYDALEVFARNALETLHASRSFIVRFDANHVPMPVETEYATPIVRRSLRGAVLDAEFTQRLHECAKASPDASLIEIPSGLSPLPLDQSSEAEWYVTPGGFPCEAVVGLQWNVEPPPAVQDWTNCLAQCIKMSAGRIHAANASSSSANLDASAPVTETAELDLPIPIAEAALSKLNEGIIILDGAGVVRYVNPVAEFMVGCPSVHFLGSQFYATSRRYSPENATIWDHLAASPQEQQFTIDFKMPDGNTITTVFVALALQAIPSPHFHSWEGGRIIVIRDVTFIRTETARAIEESMRHDHLTAGAAYELPSEQVANLRTSLQMVLGFSELLHRGEYGAMNPQQFEMFRNIEHHARRMADLLGMPPTP